MKRRLALTLLAALALWPLAHRVLVARYDLNPWKLAGFAMYATPTPPVLVVVLQDADGRPAPLDERALPAPARRALDRFRAERHALGRLRRPDDLAQALFRARPDLDALWVLVQRMQLDPATARMTSVRERFAYERDWKPSGEPG